MLKQYDTPSSTPEEDAPPGAEPDEQNNTDKGQAFASITTV